MKKVLLFLLIFSVLAAAEKRVKDLTKTATTPAADDYLVIDGPTQGTRKILTNNIVAKIADGAQIYGSPTQVPVITVDVNGRITAISNVTASAIGGGAGTVTSFSAGNFSPLFTTTEATVDTTPALSFVTINQNANIVYAGPATGAAAAPTFRALALADMPAGIGNVTGSGLTNGNIIVGTGSGGVATRPVSVDSSGNIVTAGNVTANVITGNSLALTSLSTVNLSVSGNIISSTVTDGQFFIGNATGDRMQLGALSSVNAAITVTNSAGAISLTATGNFATDVEALDVGEGFILKSPNGTRWRLTVSDAGVVGATSL